MPATTQKTNRNSFPQAQSDYTDSNEPQEGTTESATEAPSPWRNVLIGLGAGLGAGLMIYALSSRSSSRSSSSDWQSALHLDQARKLGEEILNSVGNAVPEAVSRHFR